MCRPCSLPGVDGEYPVPTYVLNPRSSSGVWAVSRNLGGGLSPGSGPRSRNPAPSVRRTRTSLSTCQDLAVATPLRAPSTPGPTIEGGPRGLVTSIVTQEPRTPLGTLEPCDAPQWGRGSFHSAKSGLPPAPRSRVHLGVGGSTLEKSRTGTVRSETLDPWSAPVRVGSPSTGGTSPSLPLKQDSSPEPPDPGKGRGVTRVRPEYRSGPDNLIGCVWGEVGRETPGTGSRHCSGEGSVGSHRGNPSPVLGVRRWTSARGVPRRGRRTREGRVSGGGRLEWLRETGVCLRGWSCRGFSVTKS